MNCRSTHVARFAPAGTPGCSAEYRLTAAETSLLASRMIGIPVTYDHRGIAAALDIVQSAGAPLTKPNVMRGLARASETDPKQRPIGLVHDAWVAANGDGMCTFSVRGNAAKTMIEEGNLASVSLTHMASTLDPLELSICNVPARPGSRVVFKSIAGPQQTAAYKAYTLQHPKRAATASMPETRSSQANSEKQGAAAAAAAAASAEPQPAVVSAAGTAPPAGMTLQQALLLLPEEARAALADKFAAQADDLTRASAELDAAKSKLKVTEDFNKTECALLTEQLKLLMQQMPKELRDIYSPNVPQLVDSFASGDPRSCMDAAFRTITCASRALQLKNFGSQPQSAPHATKRMRTRDASSAMATDEDDNDAVKESTQAPDATAAAFAPLVTAAAAPIATKSAAQPAMSNLARLNAALGLAFD